MQLVTGWYHQSACRPPPPGQGVFPGSMAHAPDTQAVGPRQVTWVEAGEPAVCWAGVGGVEGGAGQGHRWRGSSRGEGEEETELEVEEEGSWEEEEGEEEEDSWEEEEEQERGGGGGGLPGGGGGGGLPGGGHWRIRGAPGGLSVGGP